jgi:hypothetical protein
MPYTSCYYALFGVECYRISLRETWRHFLDVMSALDDDGLNRYRPLDELKGWAGPSMDKAALGYHTQEVLEAMRLPRAMFVVFDFNVERPDGAR